MQSPKLRSVIHKATEKAERALFGATAQEQAELLQRFIQQRVDQRIEHIFLALADEDEQDDDEQEGGAQ